MKYVLHIQWQVFVNRNKLMSTAHQRLLQKQLGTMLLFTQDRRMCWMWLDMCVFIFSATGWLH
jgi:hypothetical protein